jgi:hypothetical protein
MQNSVAGVPMSRSLVSRVATTGVAIAVLGALAVAQPAAEKKPVTPATPAKAAAPAGKEKTWSAPRLSDGHPDLQGVWTNATITPLQRAPQFADKPTLTEAEATAFEKSQIENAAADRHGATPEADRDQAYNRLFIDRGTNFARVDGQIRTSLIVDPPDGHLPPRVNGMGGRGGGRRAPPAAAPEASEEGAARGAAFVAGRFDSVKDRPLGERCLLGFGSTSGPPMMPVLYNNNYQIVQTPDTIMILVEMVHDVRMIRMDGSPHLPKTVTKWLGDSIGHWEGDTLVVDTTNFTAKTRYQGTSPNLHVIERFKRVDDHTILYRFTVDDPTTFTKQWTAEYPFLATKDNIYEYACHEGNYAMPDILGGARKDDAAAAAKKGSTK